jgi:hypothetical protein
VKEQPVHAPVLIGPNRAVLAGPQHPSAKGFVPSRGTVKADHHL